MRFDEFMEMALYDGQNGFFAGSHDASGQAGTSRGDFITSPEVGPLFGLLISRFLDQCWIEAGRPNRFDVVEYAAGRGALALGINAGMPACLPVLRYHMVERSARLRERQHEHLSLVDADDTQAADRDSGPQFISHADESTLPQDVSVVLANELLDNIPFRLFQRTPETSENGWSEIHLVHGAGGTADRWTETLDPVPHNDAAVMGYLAPNAQDGARVPLQEQAGEWLRCALERVHPGGTVLVIDYCRSTPEMAADTQRGWLRTYRSHERGGPIFESPGTQDITVDVAADQLDFVYPITRNVSQAAWLLELGIDELVSEGRQIWEAAAHAPDLNAFRARSRINEAQALTDPTGLGGFRVLIWS